MQPTFGLLPPSPLRNAMCMGVVSVGFSFSFIFGRVHLTWNEHQGFLLIVSHFEAQTPQKKSCQPEWLTGVRRAENETRTRDPNLGKVVLYQLSYFRKNFPLRREGRMKCPKQDSNLHASRHTHLKRARLPIPPLGPFRERKTRLELATPTLARLCSTN